MLIVEDSNKYLGTYLNFKAVYWVAAGQKARSKSLYSRDLQNSMRSCDVHSFLCKKIPRNSQEAAATQLYTALKLEPAAAADMAHD